MTAEIIVLSHQGAAGKPGTRLSPPDPAPLAPPADAALLAAALGAIGSELALNLMALRACCDAIDSALAVIDEGADALTASRRAVEAGWACLARAPAAMTGGPMQVLAQDGWEQDQ